MLKYYFDNLVFICCAIMLIMSVNYQFIKKKGHTVGCLHTFIVMSITTLTFYYSTSFSKVAFSTLGYIINNNKWQREKEPCVHNLEVIVVLVNNYNGFWWMDFHLVILLQACDNG